MRELLAFLCVRIDFGLPWIVYHHAPFSRFSFFSRTPSNWGCFFIRSQAFVAVIFDRIPAHRSKELHVTRGRRVVLHSTSDGMSEQVFEPVPQLHKRLQECVSACMSPLVCRHANAVYVLALL